MSKEKYQQEIFNLNEEILKKGDYWELYYRRGYFHFLLNNEDEAKNDYKLALQYGADVTEVPYYSFANSNEYRRDFILPEKILVILILIVIIISVITQVVSFISKFN